ncbi:uncharacterized protein LOC111031018 [Myzus persicae]|uniref:uncharacterized protein LOC111031018 n=1 Tax=Myzus persicae TaxID=13164 RepID=UPI000B936D85|nr:uncharacterized protein LOC111031018 [Myzus persicae]XP_022166488.1 uncharacterized protein LOC111031018 [Myzus persicae]XP_022166489.1 uncharacterized protein LOC111031018 [Myzus persicae]
MDPQDINNSTNKRDESKKNSITSFKAVLNEESCLEDDNEQYINNLSIGDLDSKVKKYNALYLENKINVLNAFDIDLISCVQQMVKRSKETDILGISNTFDAISKVYSCRVDDILISGNKLVKEFVAEAKNQNLVKENAAKTKQKCRKKLMLTTPDKLCCKDNEMLLRKNYLSVDLDNDMIDYAKPSRILLNRYSNDAYWPEYRVSKNIKVNENQQETYEMENIISLLENGQICPSFHRFVADRDKITNSDDDEIDINILNNIQTHFNQETSAFCSKNSEESDEAMDEDLNEPSSELIVHTDPGPSNQNNNQFGRLENLDSLSQTLSMLDTNDSSDYTFFDRKQLRKFKCSNHWKVKVKMMKTDSKQKAMLIKSRASQTHSETNVPEYKCRNSRAITFKVDFYSDISTKLENLRLNSDKNYCSYTKWKPSNNLIPSSGQLNTIPIRQFESCKYINMIPNWYKHEFEKLNLNSNPNSLFLFPGQDILRDRLLVDEVPLKNTDCIDNNVMDIDHYSECGNEVDEMMTVINNDNNLTIALNQKNTQDNAYKEYSTCSSGYLDMNQLKKYIMNIIKPDDEETLNISFADLLLRLPKLLPDNMKENITVSVIYVALLHLCNEHSLCLEDRNGDIFIVQGSVNLKN